MGLSAEAFILHLFEDNLFNFISTSQAISTLCYNARIRRRSWEHYCPLKSRDENDEDGERERIIIVKLPS